MSDEEVFEEEGEMASMSDDFDFGDDDGIDLGDDAELSEEDADGGFGGFGSREVE